jgi:hypothetical protein
MRPKDEFAHGHEADALNIPLRQIERRLAELPACGHASETRSQGGSNRRVQGDNFAVIDWVLLREQFSSLSHGSAAFGS